MLKKGELNKLKITAFKDDKYSEPLLINGNNEFTALVNPERYALSHKTDFEIIQSAGSSDGITQFKQTTPKEFELDLLFDRTGVFPTKDIKTSVDDDIKHFQELAFNYVGEIHQPSYLKIKWGTLEFRGRLSEMNIDYKLFSSDGTPIRAVVKVKFISATNAELIAAKENKKSPDLTHVRTVKEGDTLPLMTYRIYGDSKYYLEVAKVNKLSSFRKLIVGQEIVFPPVQKVGING